jgi:hypothetical protein
MILRTQSQVSFMLSELWAEKPLASKTTRIFQTESLT